MNRFEKDNTLLSLLVCFFFFEAVMESGYCDLVSLILKVMQRGGFLS